MKQDYSQSVSMQCSTCGKSDFEFEGDNSPVRCVGCGRIYTREELIHENGAQIDSEVEGMKT
jgi:ribosomal protein S27E